MMKQRQTMAGFTLLELMIVVMVVAILATVAFPSYTRALKKSHRGDATTTLLQIAQKQEAYYARNAIYANNFSDLGFDSSVLVASKVVSQEGYYQVSNAAPSVNSYVLVANVTDLDGQDSDEIKRFRLLSTGLREHSLVTSGDADEDWDDGWTE